MSVEAFAPGPFDFDWLSQFQGRQPVESPAQVALSAEVIAEQAGAENLPAVSVLHAVVAEGITDLAEVTARTQVEAAYASSGIEAVPVSTGTLANLAANRVALAPAGVAMPIPAQPLRKPRFMEFFDRRHKTVEHSGEPSFGLRPSTREDVAAMVEIDMRSFSKVYNGEGYAQNEAEQRSRLTEMFNHRYDLLGGDWMPVVTKKDEDGADKVVGFMHTCPTSKDPTTFVSWEETTDQGMLDSLYDANGKNAYVVTLSMDPSVKGERGQNSLFMQQIGQFVQNGGQTAFFESRMPGFSNWVSRKCKAEGTDMSGLDDATKNELAQQYFALKRTNRKGKEVPYDPLLKVYDGAGCKLVQVLPDAYVDQESMNFGVLCTYENPLPSWIRRSEIASRAIGGALKQAAKSSWLTRKLFG